MIQPISDELSKKQIIDRLFWDSRVNAADILVEVKEGVAILTGTVPDYQTRRITCAIVRDVSGVDELGDHLRVEPIEPVPDKEIKGNVQKMLGWDAALGGFDFEITVDDGHVTLEGVVDACWQKRKAADLTANLMGVSAVTNHIAIAPTGDFVDQVLAANAMQSLEACFPLNGAELEVRVDGGRATVSGTLPNWQNVQRALAAIEHVAGIIKVNNEIVLRAHA